MEATVSYSLCAKVSAKSDIWATESGHRKDTPKSEQKKVEILEAEACPVKSEFVCNYL